MHMIINYADQVFKIVLIYIVMKFKEHLKNYIDQEVEFFIFERNVSYVLL